MRRKDKDDAYHFLLEAARSGELNERQLGHVLYILLKLRLFVEDRTELF
jgi:hypothetical protein